MIYIYALCCPRTGEIRYIGKTNNLESRLKHHISTLKIHSTLWRARWMASLISEGLRPTIKALRELPEGSDWAQAERDEIAKHYALGCRLTNLTSGGEGVPDLPPHLIRQRAEKTAKKFSALWADPERRERMIQTMRTPQAKENRSNASKRRMADPANKAAHAEKMKAKASTPEGRAQLQAASVKRWADYREANPPAPPPTAEELQAKAELKRERQRKSAIARWQRPGEVERIKDTRWTEEKRAAQAAALQARREKMNAAVSTEGRARQAEAMRRIWAERKAAKT